MTKPRPFGHYFILEKIAQGGMAEIFKGLTYDFSGLKKFIVIKRILPHIAANKDFIRMLIDEAKIAVRLNHGNIAQTFDLGKVADDYFIVMEYVDGRTISQIFKKSVEMKQPLPVPMAAYVVSELANGLDYMHRRRDEAGRALEIVHRDISPQNVIVTYSGNVKIVDFGVAKAASKLSEMESGVLKGKFAYMSPEQTEGKPIDHRSDIFSTGVVLWEILTGRRLFKKKSNAETIDSVQHMMVYPPSAYRNDIPSDLDEIAMCALDRDPTKRFGNAADMSLALTKFILKHYSEFKPSQIHGYLEGVFQDEDRTGDLYQEKTTREELTVKDGFSSIMDSEEVLTPVEETMIIDPQELDFHSIFEEIDVEEVSDITRSIVLKDEALQSKHASSPSGETAVKAEEEITGDVVGDQAPPFLPARRRTPPSGGRKNQIQAALILSSAALALVLIYWFFITKSPSKPDLQTAPEMKKIAVLRIQSEPAGAAVFIDGQPTGRVTPATLETASLSFPIVVGLSKGGPPQWQQRIETPPAADMSILAHLAADFAYLDLESTPKGAKAAIDGKAVGKTPIRNFQVPAGKKLTVSMELGGFEAFKKELILRPGGNERVEHAFHKNPSR